MYSTEDEPKCKGENGMKMMGDGIGRRPGWKPGLPRLNRMFYPPDDKPRTAPTVSPGGSQGADGFQAD